MKEALEEFGSTILICIIGGVVLIGIGALLNNSSMLADFANAYLESTYGQSV